MNFLVNPVYSKSHCMHTSDGWIIWHVDHISVMVLWNSRNWGGEGGTKAVREACQNGLWFLIPRATSQAGPCPARLVPPAYTANSCCSGMRSTLCECLVGPAVFTLAWWGVCFQVLSDQLWRLRENSGWDAGPRETGNFSPTRAVPTVGGLSPWPLEGSVRPSKPGAPEKSQVCTLGDLASGARFFRTVLKACRMVSWLLCTL